MFTFFILDFFTQFLHNTWAVLKFIYCAEKAIIWCNLPLFLNLLNNVKTKRKIAPFFLPSQKTWILKKCKSEFLNRFLDCWTVCTRGTRAGFAWPLVCYLESTCSRREIEIRYSHSVSFYKDWNNNLITGLICQFFISFRVN